MTTLDLERPWRAATVIATAVAALEFVVLVALAGVLIAQSFDDDAGRTSTAQPAAVAAKRSPTPAKTLPNEPAELSRGNTKVLVLNGNGRTGAAAGAAAALRGRGYRIGAVGNASSSDYTRSIVMYRRGFRGEALRLARDFQIAVVEPLDGMRPAELEGAHVALIVGGP